MPQHLHLFVDGESRPLWQPRREFLREIVHDARGVLRRCLAASDLLLLRTVDDRSDERRPDFAVDAGMARHAYAQARACLAEAADAAVFHWIGRDGHDGAAAVEHFEMDGQQLQLLGGWSAPMLRDTDTQEILQSFPRGTQRIEVGAMVFHVRAEPIAERFEDDLARLDTALAAAERHGASVRFCLE